MCPKLTEAFLEIITLLAYLAIGLIAVAFPLYAIAVNFFLSDNNTMFRSFINNKRGSPLCVAQAIVIKPTLTHSARGQQGLSKRGDMDRHII